jgi:excisionase family DNA binding protein
MLLTQHLQEEIMMKVSIPEAAATLGVSQDTIRRRIHKGELKAEKVHTPKGPAWLIDLPGHAQADATTASADSHGADRQAYAAHELGDYAAPSEDAKTAWAEVHRLEQMVSILQSEVESRRREVQELHVLLQQAQAALPAPRDNRPWWQRLWRRE